MRSYDSTLDQDECCETNELGQCAKGWPEWGEGFFSQYDQLRPLWRGAIGAIIQMMRGKQPHEDLWRMLLSWHSRCKGTGVGMSLEEQRAEQHSQATARDRKEYAIIAGKRWSQDLNPRSWISNSSAFTSSLSIHAEGKSSWSPRTVFLYIESLLSLHGYKIFFEQLWYLKYHIRDAQVVRWFECSTLDFSSSHDLGVVGWSPVLVLHSGESLLEIFPLPLPLLLLMCTLSLSQVNK